MCRIGLEYQQLESDSSFTRCLLLFNAGSFAYIDAAANTDGARAEINILPFELRNGDAELTFCLHFFYHMLGDNIGRLEVTENGDDAIWSATDGTYYMYVVVG